MHRLLIAALVCSCSAPPADLNVSDDDGTETDDGMPFEPAAAITPAAALQLGGNPAWVHFANPPAGGVDPTIITEAIRLIHDTPAGADLHAAVHSLVINGVATELADAKQRGVHVRMVEDGSDEFDADDSPRTLAAALGADHLFCGQRKQGGNYGCITNDTSGIMHTKLFTFSQTKDPTGALRDHVVWFGSANMTHATGTKTFNNAITIYGDAELYADFEGYFDDLWHQRHFGSNDYYDAAKGRGYFTTPSARVYASPEHDGDLIDKRLNDIDADADCTVRVSEAMIHDGRPALVDRLVTLKQHHCTVRVVAGDIQAKSLAKLQDAGITVEHAHLHDKYILIDAKFAGSAANRKIVFTGSHNWTTSANSKNDELFVRVEGDAVFAAYLAHFGATWNAGTPL